MLGAWVLAKALLDTHAPLAAPLAAAITSGASGPASVSNPDASRGAGQHDLAGIRDDEDAMLIDCSFLAKQNLNKQVAAAADEAFLRVLEAGPSSLDAVKEATGALKSLIAGLLSDCAAP